jgi:hypothetical protein
MPNDNSQDKAQLRALAGTMDVLKQLAARLEAPPLVYGLAGLLVLVIIAGFSIDTLSLVAWPAVAVFVLGLIAWVALEWRKLHSADAARQLDAEVQVDVQARDVGRRGSVTGVEGMPTSRDGGKVRVEAERIEGRVTGVRYESGDDAPKADR